MNAHERRDPKNPLRRVKDYRPDGTRRRVWSRPERKYRLTYRRRPFATAASTAVAVLAVPALAFGAARVESIFTDATFRDSGWTACQPITYTTDTRNLTPAQAAELRPQLAKAFQIWSNGTGYTFIDAGESPVVFDNASSSVKTVANIDRNIAIYFAPDSESTFLTKTVVGFASPSLVWTDSREITGGYAVYSTDYIIKANPRQQTALFAHEIGHALGLADSKDPSNTMYYLVNKTTKLSEGDTLGIRSIIKPCK